MDVHFPRLRSFGPPPADVAHAERQRAYAAAKRQALATHATDPEHHAHRQIVNDLAGELRESIPFPMALAAPGEDHPDKVIEVAAHDFELARLVHMLNWMTRLALTKGAGSYMKMPDLLASRGAGHPRVETARSLEDFLGTTDPALSGLAFAAALVEGGNCAEHAAVAVNLARTMDQAMLAELGIDLDPAKLSFVLARDGDCDHAYALARHADDGALDWHDPGTFRHGWSIDPHALYPMACRYDQSPYNHSHADFAPIPGPRAPFHDATGEPPLDLGAVHEVREQLEATLGPRWAEQDLTRPTFLDRLRNPALEYARRIQGVGDPMQIDTGALGTRLGRRLQSRQAKLERRIALRLFAAQIAAGRVKESWVGLYLPRNPNTVYYNVDTGELLAPVVPARYLEATERKRWAWAVYCQPPVPQSPMVALQARRQAVPPAVEAIEQEPVLAALAAARALDFTGNGAHPERVQEFGRALSALERWIGRIHRGTTPRLLRRVHATGLQPQFFSSLLAVGHNLHALSRMVQRMEAAAEDGSLESNRAASLHRRVAASPAWSQTTELIETLAPSVGRQQPYSPFL
jgi:hypothetical protein